MNAGLKSIDSDYRGMHQYFNDAPSMGVLAVILLLIGIRSLVAVPRDKKA
ncbi:MAG: hypothetical protein JWN86_3243 [Planctomycetota bacterium]|nr:hypothetical protein [Planctomycetota bacterium]